MHTSAKAKGELVKGKVLLSDLTIVVFFAGIAKIKRILLLLDVTNSGLKALFVEVLYCGLKLLTDMSEKL